MKADRIIWFIVACWLAGSASVQAETGEWVARDTLRMGRDSTADARECLQGFWWKRSRFPVRVEKATDGRYPWLVSFPSPLPTGAEVNDRVTVEWHAVRDDEGLAKRAPAVVVVHESGSAMEVGRLFARSMQASGVHGFLVQLPYYGERRGEGRPEAATQLVRTLQQGSADVRRARDAVAALPAVDSRYIAVQGTSLGGFVVACSASLDNGFDDCFIMLAGGQLYEMISSGQKDTASAREELAAAGYEGEKLRQLLAPVEPTRLGHRLDRQITWMYIAKQDTVVPLASAKALADVARLEPDHQMMLEANHYSAILHLPKILDHIITRIRGQTANLK
jgi:dienelactone hydrolase